MTAGSDDALRELVDREQIRALKYAYCRYADALDIAGMVSGFTEDCRINFVPDGSQERRGRDEVEAFYAKAQSVVSSSSHHLSNMDVVFLGPDRAAMHSYLYSWQRFVGYPEVKDRHRWARYEDVFVRTPNGWRQSELLYLVAGELASGDHLRFREVVDRPVWGFGATSAPSGPKEHR
jgi:ketosteroid isomerase-like protein